MFRSSLLRAGRLVKVGINGSSGLNGASILVNSKRHASDGIPTNAIEPPLYRTPDDNKALPGEYPYYGSWIIEVDRQIDPRYPHVITERAAERNPIGKNYDDPCERRNFGDPVHEDDEMFSIYIYDWSKNTSNTSAFLQSFTAFASFFLFYGYCASKDEPWEPKELPYASSSCKYTTLKKEY